MKIPADILIMVYSLVGSNELAKKWWTSQNLAFDSLTPEEMYKQNPEKVLGYLQWHCFG